MVIKLVQMRKEIYMKQTNFKDNLGDKTEEK